MREYERTGKEESKKGSDKKITLQDVVLKKYISTGRCVKSSKRQDLFNCDCYKFNTLLQPQNKVGLCELK